MPSQTSSTSSSTHRPFRYPADVLPPVTIAQFPDVYAAFFGGGREAAFLTAIDRFGVEARAGIGGRRSAAPRTCARSRDDVRHGGRPAPPSSARRPRCASSPPMRASSPSACSGPRPTGCARAGGEPPAGPARGTPSRRPSRRAASHSSAPRSPPTSARCGASGPSAAPGPSAPTSPHILARHGRLGGVRVPRMTVNAPRRMPDRELAALVADALPRPRSAPRTWRAA